MPAKFSLNGHLDYTFADWHSSAPMRDDQWHRSTLAGYLNIEANQLANEVGPGHAERWQRVKDLRVVASQIQNNGASSGSLGELSWRLEFEPAAKPADDEAA